MDEEMIRKMSRKHKILVTIEENVATGGYGERVLEYTSREGLDVRVLPLALSDAYVEHGSIDVLRKANGIDSGSMTKTILDAVKES